MAEAHHEVNPYAVPESDLEQPSGLDSFDAAAADETCRRYQGRETLVRWIAALFDSVAVCCFATVAIGAAMYSFGQSSDEENLGFIAISVILGCLTTLGIGLKRFHPWSRWACVAFSAVSALFLGVAAMMSNLIEVLILTPFLFTSLILLFVMLLPKTAKVFTRDYRTVLRHTAHIRARPGCVLRIFLGFVILLLFIAICAGI